MPLSQAPEEVKIGQELEVKILEVNEERMTELEYHHFVSLGEVI